MNTPEIEVLREYSVEQLETVKDAWLAEKSRYEDLYIKSSNTIVSINKVIQEKLDEKA